MPPAREIKIVSPEIKEGGRTIHPLGVLLPELEEESLVGIMVDGWKGGYAAMSSEQYGGTRADELSYAVVYEGTTPESFCIAPQNPREGQSFDIHTTRGAARAGALIVAKTSEEDPDGQVQAVLKESGYEKIMNRVKSEVAKISPNATQVVEIAGDTCKGVLGTSIVADCLEDVDKRFKDLRGATLSVAFLRDLVTISTQIGDTVEVLNIFRNNPEILSFGGKIWLAAFNETVAKTGKPTIPVLELIPIDTSEIAPLIIAKAFKERLGADGIYDANDEDFNDGLVVFSSKMNKPDKRAYVRFRAGEEGVVYLSIRKDILPESLRSKSGELSILDATRALYVVSRMIKDVEGGDPRYKVSKLPSKSH